MYTHEQLIQMCVRLHAAGMSWERAVLNVANAYGCTAERLAQLLAEKQVI